MTVTKTRSLVWMFFCVRLGLLQLEVFVLQSEYFYKRSLLTVVRLLKVLNLVAVDTQHVFFVFFLRTILQW